MECPVNVWTVCGVNQNNSALKAEIKFNLFIWQFLYFCFSERRPHTWWRNLHCSDSSPNRWLLCFASRGFSFEKLNIFSWFNLCCFRLSSPVNHALDSAVPENILIPQEEFSALISPQPFQLRFLNPLSPYPRNLERLSVGKVWIFSSFFATRGFVNPNSYR